jgi:hypothetical protein
MSVDQFLLSADTTDLNYPEIRPTLDLNFARVKALDPRITFTRSSGGSYVGADGLIKYAGVNEARFDHDPITGESLGLLIEESRSNLFTWSERFDIWSKIFLSVVLNSGSSPDGNFNAIQIIEDTTINAHYLSRTIGTITSGLPYTVSCFAKSTNPNRFFSLIFENSSLFGGVFPRASFDLTSGKIHTITSATSAKIENYGNGWYRCSVTATPSVTGNASIQLRLQTNVTANLMIGPYTGDGVSGLYLWGAQAEQGAFPTSYIPTQGSTRTRAADNTSITGKNFSDFYNQSEGTIFSEAKGVANISGGNTRRYWEIGRGGFDNRLLSGYNSSILVRLLVVKDGLTSASITETNQNPFNNSVKVATSFANNYYRLYSNNLYGNPVNSGILPIVNRIDLGGTSNNAGAPQTVLNGTISRLTYFPKRLPNAQLQALTR